MRNNLIILLELRRSLKNKLADKGDESPENTSLVILSHFLKKPKTWILAHGEYILTPDEIRTLQNNFAQYLQGVPLPYILGVWDFFGRCFKVTPDVLIPRPETELLVEIAIAWGHNKEPLSIVDVGTGSGAIAVSLAAALPHACVIAIDISRKALKVARENTETFEPGKIKLIQSDLLIPFRSKFDLICANLPYIPSQTLEALQVAKWEPKLALDGGLGGLDMIKKLIEGAKTRIAKEGCILLEIDSSQGEASLKIAKKSIPGAKLQLHKDLAGLDRILQIQLP